jgi:single-strand DNA-binding protein
MDYSRVTLKGRLTVDPEVCKTQGGSSQARFNIAINRKFTKRDETKGESVTFIPIYAYGKLADNAEKYLKKGSAVLVEGSMEGSEWKDKNTNEKKKILYVVAQQINFLDKKKNTENVAGDSAEPF